MCILFVNNTDLFAQCASLAVIFICRVEISKNTHRRHQ